MQRFLLLFFLCFLFGTHVNASSVNGFSRGEALITAQELKVLLDKNTLNLIIFAVANLSDYSLGHIPGSYRLWRSDYESKEGSLYPFGGMASAAPSFQSLLRRYGVNNDSLIVLYDYKYDATRLGWFMHIYGKEKVEF